MEGVNLLPQVTDQESPHTSAREAVILGEKYGGCVEEFRLLPAVKIRERFMVEIASRDFMCEQTLPMKFHGWGGGMGGDLNL